MRRAAQERSESNRPPVKYCIVLTKIDKAQKKELMATRKDIEAVLKAGLNITDRSDLFLSQVSVMETSATARIGREVLWKKIINIVS